MQYKTWNSKKQKKPGRRKGYNDHHRLPKAFGGSSEGNNIIMVRADKHAAFHKLFGIMTPEEIAIELSKTWIPPDWELIAVKKGQAVLNFNETIMHELRSWKD